MVARDGLLRDGEDAASLGPLSGSPPKLSVDEACAVAANVFGVDGGASRLESERDANFRVDTDGGSYVLKVYNEEERENLVAMQTEGMRHVAVADPRLGVPRVVPTLDGRLHGAVELAGRRHAVHLITLVPGRRVAPDELDEEGLRAFGAFVARVGRALRGFFHPAAQRTLLWDVKQAASLRPLVAAIDDPERAAVAAVALDRFQEAVLPALPALRAQVVHNDLTYDNVLVGQDLRPISVVDFGDATHTPLLFDLAVALASFCRGEDVFERAEAFVRGYGTVTPLEEEEAALLGDAVSARMTASVVISALRARRFPDNVEYITAFDEGTWPVLERFHELGAAELRRRFRSAAARAVAWREPGAPAPRRSTEELVERRRRLLGPAISPLTYERPLHFVRGEGVWMVAADGTHYLDAYNNVPAVGHSHPHVVAALTAQARLLNTNARYLHETALDLAERLLATMPSHLDTCLFVNSGSEANDLAWRFATAATGASGGIVSRWAYHGVTDAQTHLSPSEWAGERPEHVATVDPPDGYRGRHRRDEPGWDVAYADSVDEALTALGERGHPPAAILLDAGWTSDGVFTDAARYAGAAARKVAAAGGLYVADEVQTGFGRFGASLWGFQASDVEPDFVTLGKPMGNGHPVAAVVTRSPIAEEFARRRAPVFSTFGGNPVACAAALAVLDVIEEERLLENVTRVGAYLRSGLEDLARRHPVIGDVRGAGLLLGVDLVEDAESRRPAPGPARRVANGLRERGVLIGLTGPAENVLKIRPPLVFSDAHADRVVETLDEVLALVGRGRGSPAGAGRRSLAP